MLEFTPEQQAAIEAACAQHLENCRNYPESPDSSDGPAVSDDREPASVAANVTDNQLFEEAIACDLVSYIRLAAACHPDRIKLEEVCSPANAALIVFARNVLARWGN